jgi:histidine ammonia-lyase
VSGSYGASLDQYERLLSRAARASMSNRAFCSYSDQIDPFIWSTQPYTEQLEVGEQLENDTSFYLW